MAVNTKRVFYVKYLAHQSYLDTIAKRPDIRLDRLENDSAPAAVDPILATAHAYQIGSSRYEIAPHFHATAELLARIPNLLIVSANGAGYDTIDVRACTAAGVLVLNQAGGNREAVAEHAIGMMLTLSKRISESDRALRRGDVIDRNSFVGDDVHGRTIGIVGLGHVGRRVAELARGLFAMRALAYDPYLSAGEIAERGAEKVELADLLRQADYVSLNCPLTDETRGMIGAREFALMQPHAYFITTCRGHVHDETALFEALRSKRIAGAGSANSVSSSLRSPRNVTARMASSLLYRSRGACPNVLSNRLAYNGHTSGLTTRETGLPSSASMSCSAAIRPIFTRA